MEMYKVSLLLLYLHEKKRGYIEQHPCFEIHKNDHFKLSLVSLYVKVWSKIPYRKLLACVQPQEVEGERKGKKERKGKGTGTPVIRAGLFVLHLPIS